MRKNPKLLTTNGHFPWQVLAGSSNQFSQTSPSCSPSSPLLLAPFLHSSLPPRLHRWCFPPPWRRWGKQGQGDLHGASSPAPAPVLHSFLPTSICTLWPLGSQWSSCRSSAKPSVYCRFDGCNLLNALSDIETFIKRLFLFFFYSTNFLQKNTINHVYFLLPWVEPKN